MSDTHIITGAETTIAGFIGCLNATWTAKDETGTSREFKRESVSDVVACRNFTDFRMHYGDCSSATSDNLRNLLAHAVNGFFTNGGTFCFVTWIAPTSEAGQRTLATALGDFERIDGIAIVAAPGVGVDRGSWDAITDHCCRSRARFAILDCPEGAHWESGSPPTDADLPAKSDFGALYFPWIEVSDPAATNPATPKRVPPSGHIAGVYARVDKQRGIHKAPANETINGATGLTSTLNDTTQGVLNSLGINCIRLMSGGIRIWGARTLQTDATDPFRYVNVCRYVNFLRKSIENGLGWTTFEPDSPDLWSESTRVISTFLTEQWRRGALLGNSDQEAFYVRCDAENNPSDRGEKKVVAEIGVAVISAGEYVSFTTGQ